MITREDEARAADGRFTLQTIVVMLGGVSIGCLIWQLSDTKRQLAS